MYVFEYQLDLQGRLTLLGLTYEETAEFKTLDGVAGGPAELRWLELLNKHEHAKLERKLPADAREQQLELL
jgi:hypothetical protein